MKFSRAWLHYLPLSDALVGAATACGLIFCTQHALSEVSRRSSWALRVLEWHPVVVLGRFSYSVYLLNAPVLALCFFALQRLGLTGQAQMAAMVGIGVPLSLGVAYIFYYFVERHFVGTPRFRKPVPQPRPAPQ